ncbi:response regulator transcription factor, partial [Nonomuraea sp. RK-328]|nr:response regulator transcription factor [Nonomuraea sp. RK-328]
MIRMLLAEDQHIIREALVTLLSLEPDIEVVDAVESGDAAVAAALVHRPDVVVLDIDMPGAIDGLDAAAQLRTRLPGCRTLMLTGH